MSTPVCQTHHHSATAIYLDPLRTERVFVVGPNSWHVRRHGRLVPLETVEPEPAALLMQSGFVEDGDYGRWPDLRAFLRDHGVEVSRKAAKRCAGEARGAAIATGVAGG